MGWGWAEKVVPVQLSSPLFHSSTNPNPKPNLALTRGAKDLTSSNAAGAGPRRILELKSDHSWIW